MSGCAYLNGTGLMYFIAAQFMGGNAFFVGLGMVCLAMAIRFRVKAALARSISNITVATGATFVVFSAAPFPWLFYLGWFCLVAVAWFVASRETRFRYLMLALLLLGSLCMALVEYPRRLPPRIEAAKCDRLFVIGDSLSMGADPPGKNWPELLGEQIGLPTKNMSFGGAMLDTALSNVERIDSVNPLVILELGGNDLLRGRRDFEQNLARRRQDVVAGVAAAALEAAAPTVQTLRVMLVIALMLGHVPPC